MSQDELNELYRLSELESIIVDSENILEEKIKNNNVKEAGDYLNYLLYSLGKSFVTTREIIMLCWTGYPDGALSLARSVFEQFIITAYVSAKAKDQDFKRLLERYDADYIVQRSKALMYEAKYIKKDKQKVNEFEEEIKKIQSKFGIKTNKDFWWTGDERMTFAKMSDEVAAQEESLETMIRVMHLLYKRACLALHASNMGNRIRLGSNIAGIDMGPWDKGQEDSLYLATSSLIYIVGSVLNYFGVENSTILERLNELAIFYRGLINERSEK